MTPCVFCVVRCAFLRCALCVCCWCWCCSFVVVGVSPPLSFSPPPSPPSPFTLHHPHSSLHVYVQNAAPCAPAPRPQVLPHAGVVQVHTGTFLNVHTEVFQRATPHRTRTPRPHNTHNTTRQHHTETGTERDRERVIRQDQREETRHDKTRREERREKMKDKRREVQEKRRETGLRCVSRLIEGTNLAILVRRYDLTHPPPTICDSQPDHHQNVHYSTGKSDDKPIQSK